jgi:single stranded DNA-binding protein
MNEVRLGGRLTKDPEVAERSGMTVCDMRLAINRAADRPTIFIDVVAFHELAEKCGEDFAKGAKVELVGALRYSEWEFRPSPKAKAQKRSKHSVIVSEITAAA